MNEDDTMEETIEEEIERKGLTAPRVTPDMIEAAVNKEVPVAWHVFPGTTQTVCMITLVNGFTILGDSACASPENFDEQLGRRLAYEDAKKKIWPFLGFKLCEALTSADLDEDGTPT